MNRNRPITLLTLIILLLSLAMGAAHAAGASPISVTDMTGRQITLQEPAVRIVALNPADCEILYALGAEDTLVGRGAYCTYPEAVLDLPTMQTGAETNIEQIIALSPQVVVMSTMAQSKEQVEALEAAGITVVVSDAKNIAGVYEAITLIGAVTGKIEEAATLITDMQSAFANIAEKAQGDGSKSIYFEVSPLQWGLWTAGSGTFMDELAALLGFTNAFADVQGWGEVSEEQVIERNPDYIVTIGMYFGEGPTPVEELMNRAGWQEMSAIQNGAVLNADSNEISLPGPRLVDAAETLYRFVYAPDTLAQ